MNPLMSNTFLPYGRQTITQQDIDAVVQVLQSPCLTQGPVVPAFEHALAEVCDSSYAVSFNSATSALHAACIALELGPGDRLWTSPISFVASANCGLYCGAIVEFIDIDLRTGLMSLSALKRQLQIAQRKGTLPKVLVPVHLVGTSCPMKDLADLADHYGFKILEDASHAVGASYDGSPVGACYYSSIAVLSFHPVKIITTGEGGAALTRDSELAERLQRVRSHGIVRENFEQTCPGPWYYEQQSLGFNYRLTDLQAALGLSQLQRLTQIVGRRRDLVARYRSDLQEFPVYLLDEPGECFSSYHLAVLSIPSATPNQHLMLFKGMRAAGIGVQLHYWPIHLQPHYRRMGFFSGQFPNAERYAQTSFSLPLFPAMSNVDQTRVLKILKALLTENHF